LAKSSLIFLIIISKISIMVQINCVLQVIEANLTANANAQAEIVYGRALSVYDSATANFVQLCVANSTVNEFTTDAQITPYDDLDSVWILLCGFMVFIMQVGFAMLEVGACRPKNVHNILFKNIGDVCFGALSWYILGYGLGYGNTSHSKEFIGTKDFTIYDTEDYQEWFFLWCFAATTSTIISGAVMERAKLEVYFAWTIMATCFLYPVASFWIWSEHGFLSFRDGGQITEFGVIDFAGAGIVHMTGGFCGMIGCYLLGPRTGSKRPNSIESYVFGTLILWFGWYGFNCGSTLEAQDGKTEVASRVAVNTTLSAATCGLTILIIARVREGIYSAPRMCNGILSGLVSITGACAVVETYSAIVIGFIGALVYYATATWLDYCGLDDPVDAASVHGFCGLWGLLAVGFFAEDYLVDDIYNFHNSWENQLRNQFIGALCLIAWTFAIGGLMFGFLGYFVGLRVPDEVEADGIDKHEHGGTSWTMDMWEFEAKFSSQIIEMKKMATMMNLNLDDYQETQTDYLLDKKSAGSPSTTSIEISINPRILH